MGSPSLTKVAGRLGLSLSTCAALSFLIVGQAAAGSLTPDGVAVNLSMFAAPKAPLRRQLTLKMNRNAMF